MHLLLDIRLRNFPRSKEKGISSAFHKIGLYKIFFGLSSGFRIFLNKIAAVGAVSFLSSLPCLKDKQQVALGDHAAPISKPPCLKGRGTTRSVVEGFRCLRQRKPLPCRGGYHPPAPTTHLTVGDPAPTGARHAKTPPFRVGFTNFTQEIFSYASSLTTITSFA